MTLLGPSGTWQCDQIVCLILGSFSTMIIGPIENEGPEKSEFKLFGGHCDDVIGEKVLLKI